MRTKNLVILFDLDGVLATRDIAFDLFKNHGWGQRYREASSSIADAVNSGKSFSGQKPYAGLTVKYVMDQALKAKVKITEAEIRKLAMDARLMRGSKRLIDSLKKNKNVKDIFIISTTYKPAADVIGKRLGIPKGNIYATDLIISKGRVTSTLATACGGFHKAHMVKVISRRSKAPMSRMVAIGDSITDIKMMECVINGGGLGIAFNANHDLLKRKLNVIFAGRSLKPVLGLIKAFSLHGHKGVKKIVDRNIKMRRAVGIPMSFVGRPFLFRPGKNEKKAGEKSQQWRARIRSKKIARLR